jgi:hypothetical protein
VALCRDPGPRAVQVHPEQHPELVCHEASPLRE